MCMAMELLSKLEQGGLPWVLNEMRIRLAQNPAPARRWAFVEVKVKEKTQTHLYLPALPRELREACSNAHVFWIECTEKQAPKVALKLLESSLCDLVFLRGLDSFEKTQPASIWGRRWQLASQKSGAELIWLHQKQQAVLGFNERVSWLSGQMEWLKGHKKDNKGIYERRESEKNYQPAA